MNVNVAGRYKGGWLAAARASAAVMLSLPLLATAQAAPAPSWSFEFSNNGVWLAGSAQTVTLTLQRTIDHTLFLDSITFTPTTVGIPNARAITACGNGVVVDGTQLNVPCAATGGPGAVCTVVQCPVTVPANYPTVSGVDVSARWKDCTKLPIIDEPSPFCGSTVSTTHSLLSIAGAAPAPSPSSTVIAVPTPTPTPLSTTSVVAATTSAPAPAKTTSASTNTNPTPPARAPTPTAPAPETASSSASASGTAISGASTLNDQIDGNSTGSGRTVGVIGGVIAGLLLLGVAGAVYWRYSRQKRLAKWDPDFGTLNNRPRPFSKGASMMGASGGGGGAVGAGAAAAAASALAAHHYNTSRADEYPQRYPSPEYYLPPTSTAGAYGQASSSSSPYPHPTYAPPPPPPSASAGHGLGGGHYDSTSVPPFMSPQNINQIQQQGGGGLTRYSTNKSMGLHVVNWQEGRNTEPAPLSYPDP
ncbi:hypothetical protein HDU87_007153 [Geranomyces variabilis]|uniref:Mid2 domain-containing protein n=1 Tax=Geranomyces variabilis TaxID=109894 RepID=A0AAD5XJW3_9FUNG|nr:hypothetical protein HDU87_007153 [Geranomyces variabilis]